MKNLFLATTITLSFFTFKSNAQDASVEKNITGIQIGPLGAWVNSEFKLTDKIALRAEAGLAAGYWAGAQYEGLGFLLTPAVRVEPRWYYNLESRVKKDRNIKSNSGNFLALQTSYYPDWFVIAQDGDDIIVRDQISLVPTWGIRRALGNHFDYEACFGIGYVHVFKKERGSYNYKADNDAVVNVHLRIGYHF